MLPVERVIGEEGLSASAAGLRLAMRLPWYRSLPFSTVEVASLALDDQPVDLAGAVVEYGDQSWPLANLGEQTNAFWFVRESAFLVLPGLTATPGDTRKVALTINVSPPYIPGMTRTNPQTATLHIA